MCVWIRRILLLYWSVFSDMFLKFSLSYNGISVVYAVCTYSYMYVYLFYVARIASYLWYKAVVKVARTPSSYQNSRSVYITLHPLWLCCSDHCTAWHCFKHCCSIRMLTWLVNVSQFLAFYQHSEFMSPVANNNTNKQYHFSLSHMNPWSKKRFSTFFYWISGFYEVEYL